jgi:hypothetical protein
LSLLESQSLMKKNGGKTNVNKVTVVAPTCNKLFDSYFNKKKKNFIIQK